MHNLKKKGELQRILEILHENYLLLQQKYNIKEICIIGSYAREEQTEESDLDIMVDFDKPIGWKVVDLKDDLEKIFGITIDLN